MNRLVYWLEGEPGSQNSWGAGDRNVSGAWSPGSNLLWRLPTVVILKCCDGWGWAEGHCVVWKSSYPSHLKFTDLQFISFYLGSSWNLFKKAKQNMSFTTQAGRWFSLFRSGQQKSYKEQNDSWISKTLGAWTMQAKSLCLGSALYTGNKSRDTTILRPLFSKTEERSMSQTCIRFKRIKDKFF